MAGMYGLTQKEREVTSRFVHKYVLPSGKERWIVAQRQSDGTYLAPVARNRRGKIFYDTPTRVVGTLDYIFGTAPDFNRKHDAQKAALRYFDLGVLLSGDIEKSMKENNNGEE